ncbi:MAG TPA: hypothetical protein VE973_02670 [Candidatus Limnocylindria bacterium]|nr:hypothetical protein [Candidatus Limnocylindria bacterium]
MVEFIRPIDLEKSVEIRKNYRKSEVSPERQAEARAEYGKKRNHMVVEAVKNHIHGISYRLVPFRVGASALAINPNIEGGYQTEAGHNYTPSRQKRYGWGKFCGETNVCAGLIKDGSEYIAAIVIVSNHKEIGDDPHDKTHNEHALHSCQNCRNLYREMIKEGIMSNETIIRFVNDDSLVYLDENDTEQWTNGTDEEPRKSMVPKLKLKKEEITEQDVENLPYEETTLGEFLNREEYRNDPPSPSGNVPPPYLKAI